ncbi:YqaA family protein [Rheinheimera sp. MMS21-TC3]|uniref:YqaA family protein n=1 Tax=Rheinheimera sp. MMS21-TC3 TaxID=3072790 RepID=UPI0028C4A21A|nr:YqaA family protein [Rheinheimera sp. MMS21-TC3]WNO61646.1 YqaA family protein [Rheinheimera sp. MMS21-TC3]
MLSYLLLFASGFLAATLFPASSEVLLLTLYHQGYQPVLLWLVASFGNTLGSCVNWWLGSRLRQFSAKRWFPFSAKSLARAERLFQRFGLLSLLFAWLPIVGDPLTLVAGVLRVRFSLFLALVLLGKAARYALLLSVAAHWY